MNSLFSNTNAWWTHYSDYQWKKAPDGQLYLLPITGATLCPYNMLTIRNSWCWMPSASVRSA